MPLQLEADPEPRYQNNQDLSCSLSTPVSLEALQRNFFQFTKMTDQRLSRIEDNIAEILEAITKPNRQHGDNNLIWTDLLNEGAHGTPHDSASHIPKPPAMSPLCEPLMPYFSSNLETDILDTPSTTSNESMTAQQRTSDPSAAARRLLKVDGVETRWFTKRPLTPFQVQMVDSLGRKVVNTDNLTLDIHLISGHGVIIDQFLCHSDSLQFPIIEGEADIAGLKFLAVSSRHGGHFKLRFEVSGCQDGESCEPLETDEIQVLSERLKNENKAETLLDLSADDPLVRVPGIGKKYATKLIEQGLKTVRDLAAIDTSPSARPKRLEILNAVRRERGALTEAKLVEMLRDARAVVKREREEEAAEETQNLASHPAKRVKPEIPVAVHQAVSVAQAAQALSPVPTWQPMAMHNFASTTASMMMMFEKTAPPPVDFDPHCMLNTLVFDSTLSMSP